MISKKYSELKYVPNTTFDKKEFEIEKSLFVKKLKKNVESYFFITHEKFEIRVYKIFKKEFNDYVDFLLKNKEKLTRIKLIKRDHEIFLRNSSDPNKLNTILPEEKEEIEDNCKELEYLDNPQNFWKDLDTKIRNMFIERYIGIYNPISNP